MGGIGSYFTQHAQQAQQALPENMQPDQSRSMNFGGSPGGNVNPYQNYGAHSVAYPGQSPQEWLAMQQGTSMQNYSRPMAQTGGYRGAWPGQGYGGMPGRFMGGGRMGGGQGNYGFGGGQFGYGGYSPFGYGPGSFSPWSAGAMGYGGGSGMYGGPVRPFTGFNYANVLQSMGAPGGGQGAPMSSYQPFEPLAPWKPPPPKPRNIRFGNHPLFGPNRQDHGGGGGPAGADR